MSNYAVIIDYGLGNLHNLKRTLEYLDIHVIISNKPEKILNADRVILPGVGSFASGMDGLNKNGLVTVLNQYVKSGKPILGICLGMQLFMQSSEEHGRHKGLGLVKGKVLPFKSIHNKQITFKVPQIGWNSVALNPNFKKDGKFTFLEGLFGFNNIEPYLYFIHSYYIKVSDVKDELATTIYAGVKYCSALRKNNIYGVQFHPELSGVLGLSILKNFSKI